MGGARARAGIVNGVAEFSELCNFSEANGALTATHQRWQGVFCSMVHVE